MDELIKTLVTKKGNIDIYASEGRITAQPVDALITEISIVGPYTGVHCMITDAAHDIFHRQVDVRSPLSEYEIIVAKQNSSSILQHGGNFKDVVFVVRSFDSSLENILYLGLDAANMQRCKSVATMALTPYLSWDKTLKSPHDILSSLYAGIEKFSKQEDTLYLKKILLTTNPKEKDLLKDVFKYAFK